MSSHRHGKLSIKGLNAGTMINYLPNFLPTCHPFLITYLKSMKILLAKLCVIRGLFSWILDHVHTRHTAHSLLLHQGIGPWHLKSQKKVIDMSFHWHYIISTRIQNTQFHYAQFCCISHKIHPLMILNVRGTTRNSNKPKQFVHAAHIWSDTVSVYI